MEADRKTTKVTKGHKGLKVLSFVSFVVDFLGFPIDAHENSVTASNFQQSS
jgi:hypothetical protein